MADTLNPPAIPSPSPGVRIRKNKDGTLSVDPSPELVAAAAADRAARLGAGRGADVRSVVPPRKT